MDLDFLQSWATWFRESGYDQEGGIVAILILSFLFLSMYNAIRSSGGEGVRLVMLAVTAVGLTTGSWLGITFASYGLVAAYAGVMTVLYFAILVGKNVVE